MNFESGYYLAIVGLALLVGMFFKASNVKDKFIPSICGFTGLILGVAAFITNVPDFPAHDWLNAAFIGAISGLAATGAHQTIKQLKTKEVEEIVEGTSGNE